MRSYQFKTINPQLPKPVSINRNIPVYTSPPPQPIVNFRIEAQSPPPPPAINQSRVTVQQQPSPTPINASYPTSQSILNMKKQLEMLVKQTDYIQKSNNSFNQNNQSFSAARSLSNNSKLIVREPPQRIEKIKNYQKYQNYLQQPLPVDQNLNGFSGFKNTQINTINNSNSFNISYQNKNRSYAPYPQKQEDERKRSRNLNEVDDISTHYKTEPAEKTQFISQKTISFGSKSPIQPKAENPERQSYTSISYQENYSSQHPKTEGLEEKSTFQIDRKQNYQQSYDSPTSNIINNVQIQAKEQEPPIKSPAARQTFETEYRPSPKETDKTEIKQLELALADLQAKFKKIQTENEKLKDGLKTTLENKDFYRNELENQRNKINKVQQQQKTKILQIQMQLQKEKEKQNDSLKKEIAEIQKLHEAQKLKIKQNHSQDIVKLKQEQVIAVSEIKKASQTQINELKQEVQNKKLKVVQLIKEIKQNQVGGSPTKSQNEKSNDLNDLYTQVAEKEFTISELHSELNSRTKHIEMLNETFEELKIQIEELKAFKQKVEVQKYESFDEILLNQMQTINELRNMIQSLNEKLTQTRLNLIQANRAIESLENQIRIMEFKHKAQVNSIRTQSEVEMSNKDNLISTLNKKMLTLEDKLRFATNDIKTKDDFIKQYLVGRSGTPEAKGHVEQVLKKYQQSFSQTTEQKLRVELAQVRKQLALYEKYA